MDTTLKSNRQSRCGPAKPLVYFAVSHLHGSVVSALQTFCLTKDALAVLVKFQRSIL